MSPNIYAYRVDAAGHIRAFADDATWHISGSTILDGAQNSPVWPGPFSKPSRDLLRVAAAALYADRLSLRRRQGTKGTERELQWGRDIELCVAVEDPERWSGATSALESLLEFMTDDRWSLSFDFIPPTLVQPPLFPTEREPMNEVALFSGGLDSVAGMYARHLHARGNFVAVSACGNDVRGRAQERALATLRELGVRVEWVKLVHQLRGSRRSRRGMEASQRSRGLLFLAMGAAVASTLRAKKVHVYETGIGCINLPFSPAQVASQGTRAMHPRTLRGIETLFELGTRFEDLLALDTDLRFALRAPVEVKVSEADVKRELLAMYLRYAGELRSFFSSARPKLRPRLQAAQKENSRGLFAAAG